ncbi:MAG TPA: substrate-binding domain-containing protein [Pseudonocardiaceae bacterium]|nr:substrate-binding domain-containing protein [Pseudonocardiaceae bacterium]
MALTETMQSVVDILGSSQGLISMAIAAAVGIGSPFMDRLVLRRKRVQYQVLYNSKIGLTPDSFEADETKNKGKKNHSEAAHPELKGLVEQLDKLSVMMIRVRNVGSSDIEVGDINPPLTVTFESREVWDARVSEASDSTLREQILEKLKFPDATENGAEPVKADEPVVVVQVKRRDLRTLRRLLTGRLEDALTEPSTPVNGDRKPELWRSVQLDDLWLRRKQSFILVLVLHEANKDAKGITKDDFEITGGHHNGRTIIEPKPVRRFTWPVVTTAIGVILVGALVGTVLAKAIVGGQRPVIAADVQCTTGTVNVAGSSAFGPIVRTLGQTYMADCPGSHVSVNSSGSLDGVRDLEGGGENDAALSDGKSVDPTAGLRQQMVAVLVYGLVVNKDVGIDRLTTDQVRGIYSGQYTNWQQLGGANEPIQLVGRSGGSGTRQAFERYVLHTSEGVLSSNNCLSKDLSQASSTILCERDTTQELISAVKASPGGIGYADVSDETTKDAVRAGDLTAVSLDGRYPLTDSLPDYPFWTVEYLYTRDGEGQPLQDFLKFLNSPSAQATLLSAGYTPCFSKDNVLNPMCTSR